MEEFILSSAFTEKDTCEIVADLANQGYVVSIARVCDNCDKVIDPPNAYWLCHCEHCPMMYDLCSNCMETPKDRCPPGFGCSDDSEKTYLYKDKEGDMRLLNSLAEEPSAPIATEEAEDPEAYETRVHTLRGDEHRFMITPEQAVWRLKMDIFDRIGVPLGQQRLYRDVFDRTTALRDDSSLGIGMNDLYLLISLRG